jgi:D-inositol-3-phosphate glycosyltransferase
VSGERPVVLVAGDGVAPTGFARVLHSILGRLTESYEFHHLAVNYGGEPHPHAWQIYPADGGGDLYGVRRVREMVERLRPRLVFLLNDPWLLGGYLDALRDCRAGLKVVAYAPVDAEPLEAELVAPLVGLDHLVLYTRFGRAAIEDAAARLRLHQPEAAFPALSVIPHGVDCTLFQPLAGTPAATAAGDFSASRAAARQVLFSDPALADAWIVLNANRNQPRKRIDMTIKGFALFARDKPANVRLYLHMGMVDCGWNVAALARRYGIEDRLILTAEERFLPAVSDEALNRIYNACDVGINTSLGEGWGLVNLEHGATGAAQVVPRHSACAEIWDGAAELMEPAVSLTMEGILTEGWLVTPEEVAAALERLYASPDLLRRRSAAAFRAATRPDFHWDDVARRWDALFRQLLAAPA